MKLKQQLLLLTTLFSVCSSFGQSKDEVFLKWKVQPNDSLKYQLISQNLDTSNNRGNDTVDLSGFFTSFLDTSQLKKLPDSLQDEFADSIKLFKQQLSDPKLKENLSKLFKISDSNSADTSIVILKKRKQNFIDIVMKEPRSSYITLRGTIYDSGSIQSFYVQNNQKNLIALYFQLPDKPIKIGDSWSLNTNLISMDQNFECDSSFKKNQVTLVDLIKRNNETIAVIKYDILEFASGAFKNPFLGNSPTKTIIKFEYNATAEFSIDKGKWLSYNGTQSILSTGMMSSNTTKKFSLIPQ